MQLYTLCLKVNNIELTVTLTFERSNASNTIKLVFCQLGITILNYDCWQ